MCVAAEWTWAITAPSPCSLESPEKGVSPGGLPRSDGPASTHGSCGRLSGLLIAVGNTSLLLMSPFPW